MAQSCDVAIVGGGPAGCATALSLRSHAPSLSVALIEKSQYEAPRVGEVLPAVARGMLQQLGVWQAFEEHRHRPVFATAVSWGGSALTENHSIYTARGHGWHLDRRAFDGLLGAQARERGVDCVGVGITAIQQTKGGWRLTVAGGDALDARFVVDATGRSASIARQLGARVLASDGLMGFARFFHAGSVTEPRTLIEASPEGWWYAAALDSGSVAIVLMTDPDIACEAQFDDAAAWHEALEHTSWVRSLLPCPGTAHAEMVRAAGSAQLDQPCGDSWIAVGDAASAYDPLSSQGIVKALRSGVFASYAIAERLQCGTTTGLERYRQFVGQSYQAYLQAYSRFYAMEQRWSGNLFWKRRQNQLATNVVRHSQ